MSNPRPTSTPKNPGGVTPTIVNGTRSTTSGVPTTFAAPPKRRCHSPSLMTTTGPSGPPPRTSSAAVNVRPSRAGTPSVVKNSPLVTSPSTSCISPP